MASVLYYPLLQPYYASHSSLLSCYILGPEAPSSCCRTSLATLSGVRRVQTDRYRATDTSLRTVRFATAK